MDKYKHRLQEAYEAANYMNINGGIHQDEIRDLAKDHRVKYEDIIQQLGWE